MRVVHIVSSLRGGAGIAARRLSEALNAVGVESTLLCRSGALDAPDAIAVDGQHENLADDAAQRMAWLFEEAVQSDYIAPSRSALSNSLFTLDYAGIPLAQHESVAEADVINLHWTSFFQSTETLAELFALGKPIVWTLHDMCPFTGGCHYSAGCEGFVTDCAQCPQLTGDPARAAERRLADKIKAYGQAANLAIVAPSAWLAAEARRSKALASARVETIPNSVDSAVFSAAARTEARRKLGVADKTVCIGFAPLDRGERRKGFAELEAALALLAKNLESTDVRLVIVGEGAETAKLAFPSIGLAALERQTDVAAVLSACDICVTPSLEDNLPNTILEAMACGVPVVAFHVGGAKDAIADGETGALVPPGDVSALAARLGDLVTDAVARRSMGQAARMRAKELFAPRRQADAYRALYQSLSKAVRKKPDTRPVSRRRLSETVPGEVLAAVWPSFVARAARAYQAALDQIVRNRHWAEKTEENLLTARDRAAGYQDWAKRSDATLAETLARLEETRQWAMSSDEALAQQRARADEMEKWARSSEVALSERITLLEQVQTWARKSDAALAEKNTLLEEVQAWAEKSDAALAERDALARDLKTWAEAAETRAAEAKRAHEELKTRQAELETELASLEARRGELSAALATAEAEIDRISWKRRLRRWMCALGVAS